MKKREWIAAAAIVVLSGYACFKTIIEPPFRIAAIERTMVEMQRENKLLKSHVLELTHRIYSDPVRPSCQEPTTVSNRGQQ